MFFPHPNHVIAVFVMLANLIRVLIAWLSHFEKGVNAEKYNYISIYKRKSWNNVNIIYIEACVLSYIW